MRSLLVGAYKNGHETLTNRVVKTDGSLAQLPQGSAKQRRQLEGEGVAFTKDGRVDLRRNPAVRL
ncbi:MAG TPA: hypothetical protein VIC56_02515 [Gemmatimonadota bacterium]